MPATSSILLCDHRRAGMREELDFLTELGHRLRVTGGLRESLAALAAHGEEAPDLVVLDPLSPTGSVELKAIDQNRGNPPIPLLVIADRDDLQAAQRIDRALEARSWDLLWRGAPRDELRMRIDRLLGTSDLLAEMEDLRHRAFHDDRTDLLRPQAFQARFVEHFSAAQRHRFELALVLLDLDKFGAVNKRHDHTVGDALIAKVGDVIRRTLRTEDVAGRLGGDEFAILLPYTGKIEAAGVVKRLREEIARLSGNFDGGQEVIEVSTSIGFETFDGTDLESLDTLRRHAEVALRHAKQSGGNQGIYYRKLSANPPAVPEGSGTPGAAG